mgnify:CR=1 FL=1
MCVHSQRRRQRHLVLNQITTYLYFFFDFVVHCKAQGMHHPFEGLIIYDNYLQCYQSSIILF